MALIDKVERLPKSPGVYLMKNKTGKVVYVGKAKELRNRVRSYFRDAGDNRLQVRFLRSNVADIDFIATDTEKEALILENNLIKQYQPRYNVKFKDDKTYVSLCLNLRNPFPRLSIVRLPKGPKRDGCLYFGPYSSVWAVRETLRVIYRTFPIRSCTDIVFSQRDRPCLYYQIGQCLGVCAGKEIKEVEYRQLIDQVILFLQGRNDELVRLLKAKMEEESKRLNFEEASRLYKRVQAVEKTIERQKIVSSRLKDLDVFGFYREGKALAIHRLLIRHGKLVAGDAETYVQPLIPNPELLSSFLNQYYGNSYIPEEVYIPFPVEGSEILAEILSERRGSKVKILCPQKGEKRQLVLMACKNAQMSFKKDQDELEAASGLLEELQKKLSLRNLPTKIECFDISNIRGNQAVGSAVRFAQGIPDKQWYRRYKIKTVHQADDYRMMAEVLERHYRQLLIADKLPDLIMVDGGKGQLNIARDILNKLRIHTPDLISLAKGRSDRLRTSKSKGKERIYLRGRKNPVILSQRSPALFLLQQIRDEAHRFAISYHKKIREKEGLYSSLEDIPGIGTRRKQQLLKHFGSLNRMSEATVDELGAVPNLSKKLAQDIFDFFHENKGLGKNI